MPSRPPALDNPPSRHPKAAELWTVCTPSPLEYYEFMHPIIFNESIQGPHQQSEVTSEGEPAYDYPHSPTLHSEEISQFLPLLPYPYDDASVDEAHPPSLSRPVRALIISYVWAITSTPPAFVITQEDIHIATCIQARMEQFGPTVDGLPFVDMSAEAWVMGGPSHSCPLLLSPP
ncbi:uncharacterized protein B0H18DRAFT_1119535 [Fomitopsis serialis]|uniref:uncharacterized protein n=1 Tax=Fomitopsis serialis TaxID=139415 RepID=UPI002008D6D1|nr:uncharacterized protein B0H18DRAFT_1124522 [Neoantrodia serialis]XP_047892850.1 uncharacterized protein B0H18DRAFT_1119535 [Neoantrodia serialis]KAH9915979.1 hypothetical protein B0H18DRAFT_1124522 [Neoantrodia serialis]KAH9925089.1 hypothetical protein B0H18DRAFT_1119535 [Neoantrodia serialis]